MTAEQRLEVQADRPGERLDVAVARLCGLSRALAHRLINAGLISEGSAIRRKPGDRLEGRETLRVRVPQLEEAGPEPESLPLDIIFEDDQLLVVSKAAGMAVHPGAGHASHTLVNAVLAHCPDLPGINGVQRPGIVHRLDKDTSGLILVAKTELAQRGLSAQLKDREVEKTYLALVAGRPEPQEALIDAPIGRDPNNRLRMMVRESGGRDAVSAYKLRQGLKNFSLLEVKPLTGRTHQIRVHLASIGRPVAGDPIYGGETAGIPRLFLHAWRLSLNHPQSGSRLELEAGLSPDLAACLQELAT